MVLCVADVDQAVQTDAINISCELQIGGRSQLDTKL
jgi:hypothetical protein